MKITEVTYSASRKINLGNFENMDIHYSAKAEVGKDKPEEVWDNLRDIVSKQVGAEQARWSDTDVAVRALTKHGMEEFKRQHKKATDKVKPPF